MANVISNTFAQIRIQEESTRGTTPAAWADAQEIYCENFQPRIDTQAIMRNGPVAFRQGFPALSGNRTFGFDGSFEISPVGMLLGTEETPIDSILKSAGFSRLSASALADPLVEGNNTASAVWGLGTSPTSLSLQEAHKTSDGNWVGFEFKGMVCDGYFECSGAGERFLFYPSFLGTDGSYLDIAVVPSAPDYRDSGRMLDTADAPYAAGYSRSGGGNSVDDKDMRDCFIGRNAVVAISALKPDGDTEVYGGGGLAYLRLNLNNGLVIFRNMGEDGGVSAVEFEPPTQPTFQIELDYDDIANMNPQTWVDSKYIISFSIKFQDNDRDQRDSLTLDFKASLTNFGFDMRDGRRVYRFDGTVDYRDKGRPATNALRFTKESVYVATA